MKQAQPSGGERQTHLEGGREVTELCQQPAGLPKGNTGCDRGALALPGHARPTAGFGSRKECLDSATNWILVADVLLASEAKLPCIIPFAAVFFLVPRSERSDARVSIVLHSTTPATLGRNTKSLDYRI